MAIDTTVAVSKASPIALFAAPDAIDEPLRQERAQDTIDVLLFVDDRLLLRLELTGNALRAGGRGHPARSGRGRRSRW